MDFIGDKTKLEVEFWDILTGDLIILNLSVFKNIELKFKENAKIYQFDDNNIEKYRLFVGYGEQLGTPWNFIETGSMDILLAEVTREKGYYSVNNIMSDDPSLSISPNKLPMTPEGITFSQNGSPKIIEVRGCHETDPELLIFTENRQSIGIEFIRICETDDDIQVESVGTEVSSATDVCIDGGVDLTIDEMKKEDKFGNPIFLQGDDVLFQDPQTGKYFVLAGDNLTCETEAHLAGPPECPSVFYTTNFIDAANNVLNKVGIDVFDAGVTTYYFNYNLYLEDGIMYANEQKLLHEHFHGDNPASTTQVFLVNDLGIGGTGIGNVQGRANANPKPGGIEGLNTVSIDVNDAVPNVLVHELGHAIWSLLHPGGPGTPNQFGIDDLDNFMHGVSNEIKNWNVRRYQFGKMH